MSPRTRIVAIILGLLTVGAAGAALLLRDSAPAVSCADMSPQPRIVAFGDSLVTGYGATAEGGFVSILSQSSGIPITNFGKNGDTTAQARARLDAVIAAQPTITLVLLGGNDALQRVPEAETEKNLSQIVEALQKAGSQVLLLGVIGGFPHDPLAPVFERVASRYQVSYVPNVLSGVIGHASLMSDQVHPNQAGYQKLADRVLPALEAQCRALPGA